MLVWRWSNWAQNLANRSIFKCFKELISRVWFANLLLLLVSSCSCVGPLQSMCTLVIACSLMWVRESQAGPNEISEDLWSPQSLLPSFIFELCRLYPHLYSVLDRQAKCYVSSYLASWENTKCNSVVHFCGMYAAFITPIYALNAVYVQLRLLKDIDELKFTPLTWPSGRHQVGEI